ncbi:MAG TPA: tetratricopeptide repeat protein, partial [Bryobacteraceae bacterium]|nr:tetratricopeptide repeat protein [Bryobacteraceae bacterium]
DWRARGNKVCASRPISVVTRFFIALLMLRISAQTVPQDPTDDPLLTKADLYVRLGQLAAAERTAREYLHGHSNSASGHFLLGSILFLQKKARESLAEYTEGAKYSAPGVRDLKIVASDYVVLSDFADADKWFTKVVVSTPHDAQAWYDLGRTKYNENRFDEAVNCFKRALQLDPTNVKAADNLGLSLGALGHNEEAIEAYKRAIALQEHDSAKNSGPYLDFGSLLVENNQMEQALPLLAEALALSPEDYRVHRELGKAYLHLNELDKARVELQKAIELAPREAPLHFMLAQVYRKQGLMDQEKLEIERYTALK